MRERVCMRVCECVRALEGCVSECICALCACVQEPGNSCLGGSRREKGSEGRERGWGRTARPHQVTAPRGRWGEEIQGESCLQFQSGAKQQRKEAPPACESPAPTVSHRAVGWSWRCVPSGVQGGAPVPTPAPHCPMHE